MKSHQEVQLGYHEIMKKNACLQIGLMMGIADCIFYAGLDKSLKSRLHINLAICQTHYKQVPVILLGSTKI